MTFKLLSKVTVVTLKATKNVSISNCFQNLRKCYKTKIKVDRFLAQKENKQLKKPIRQITVKL